MANRYYQNAANLVLGAGTRIDMDNDTLKLVLSDHADDTPNPAGDSFLSDLLVASRVAVSGALASKTISAGVFDAADVVFSALSGDQFESFTLFKDTGVEGTSDLVLYFDSYTGLPFTPSGGDLTVTWPATGIVKLVP